MRKDNSPDAQMGRWAAGITLLAFLLILYATLFPYDFSLRTPTSVWQLLGSFDLDLFTWQALSDFPRNVALFVPFGLGLAFAWRRRGLAALLLVAGVGFGLSLAIEMVQALFLLRYPALLDLLANMLGAGVGYGVYGLGQRLPLGLALLAFKPWLQRSLSVPHLVILFVAYAIFLLWLTMALQHAVALRGWDPSYSLLLGRELPLGDPTDVNEWHGSLTELYIADRAFSSAEVTDLLAASGPPASGPPNLSDSLIAWYRPTSAGPVADETGHLPDLVWQGSQPLQAGSFFAADRWLQTASPPALLSQALNSSSQFTLGFMATSAGPEQSGPAQILALSADPEHNNLTVGQEYSDLVLRLRTPFTGNNGRRPELVIPHVFADTAPRHVIITYDGTAVRAYVDTGTSGHLSQAYFLELTPDVTLFWALPHAETQQLRLSRQTPLTYKLLYYGLILIPLNTLLGLILKRLFKNDRALRQLQKWNAPSRR